MASRICPSMLNGQSYLGFGSSPVSCCSLYIPRDANLRFLAADDHGLHGRGLPSQ